MSILSFLGAKSKAIRSSAYDRREARDRAHLNRMGYPITPWMADQRRRNHEKMMAGPKMLRDIDDIDTVEVTMCPHCCQPMVIYFQGNGKESSLWLDCCDKGLGDAGPAMPVRSITSY